MDQSRSVLIVEDEVLVAMAAQSAVERLGHQVLGPAPSVDAAMRILETAQPDLALLDVSLSGETSFPVADALNARGVPFAFVTGQPSLPPRFAASPVLRKPYRPGALESLVEALAQEAGAPRQGDERG